VRGVAVVVVVMAAVACGKRADECQRMADKSGPMFAAMAQAAGREITGDDQAKIVAQCRQALAGGHRDPVLDCVLGATGDAAVRACYLKGVDAPAARTRSSEARLGLDKLAKHARAYYLARGEFPRGTAPLTPAAACCGERGGTCALPASAWAAIPAWAALELQLEPPLHFQYSYESDGATFTAKAVGDVRCDGHPVTYTASGSAPGGNPQVKVVEPAAGPAVGPPAGP
jgi:hypothetical protein